MPKDPRLQSQTRKPTQQSTGIRRKEADTSGAKSEGRAYNFNNVSSADDVTVHEENDSVVLQVGEFLD
ncbi:hypothetical protein EAI_10809 [Harpegnathos saltator]|uniref:Uncharacterized protein n=2 Tax=Harpegnathos saltator TaxID=610380 RepID=E2BVM3_HARSA|nr:hypothetical protein EAI_10809 [Harpegnathos saltator]